MPFVTHDSTTMLRPEDKGGTAKKRWRLEDGPTPPAGYVIMVSPERGTNANGVAL